MFPTVGNLTLALLSAWVSQLNDSKAGTLDNFLLSPLGLFSSLCVAYEGAGGKTELEIVKVLHVDKTSNCSELARINEFLSLQNDEVFRLEKANAAFFSDNVKSLNPEFISKWTPDYKTEIRMLSFGKRSASKTINQWFQQHTKGPKRINLQGTYTSDKIVLLDSVKLKGKWSSKFKSIGTHFGYFTDYEKSLKVQFLHRRGRIFYTKVSSNNLGDCQVNDCAEVSVIPYKSSQNRESWMLAFLKMLTPLKPLHFIDRIHAYSLDEVKSFAKVEADLKMPKFDADCEIDVIRAMKFMGMENAFARKQANFSDVTRKAVKISKMVQKCVVDVTEYSKFVENVPLVNESKMCSDERADYSFDLDSPFFYWIFHPNTGTIAFVGYVTNPL